MRKYDFDALGRSSIGFDRLFDLLNNTALMDDQSNYPPYNIVRTGDDTFRISLAVAGFAPEDRSLTAQQNLLTVTGRKPDVECEDYIYQGISGRAFERRFSLAGHVEVSEAGYHNGMLHIDLARRIPEAMKPRKIEINTATGTGKVTSIDQKRAG